MGPSNEVLAEWPHLGVAGLDPTQVAALRELGILDAVVELFVAQIGPTQAALTVALVAHDWVQIRDMAHRLGGAAVQVGAIVLAARCRAVEDLVEEGDTAAAVDGVQAVSSMLPAVIAALEVERAEGSWRA
jgi:HPt (histidine-containing phosphotransfer) domain-containing protein